jgi:hypothetical protein
VGLAEGVDHDLVAAEGGRGHDQDGAVDEQGQVEGDRRLDGGAPQDPGRRSTANVTAASHRITAPANP